MRRGKYQKVNTSRARFSKKSLLLLIVCVCTALALAVGGTLAYLSASTGPVENVFRPDTVDCEVVEPGWEDETSTVKENVTIQNTGGADAYIRAAIVVTWQDTSGQVSGETPVQGVDYTLTIPADTGWILGSDGFYYYTASVAPQEQTGVLISRGEVLAVKDGCRLHVEVLAEAVQTSPLDADSKAVEDAWGVTVAEDGTISKG